MGKHSDENEKQEAWINEKGPGIEPRISENRHDALPLSYPFLPILAACPPLRDVFKDEDGKG